MDPTDKSQENHQYLADENQERDEDSDEVLNHLSNISEDEKERLAYELSVLACNERDIVELNQENSDSRSMTEGMARNHGLEHTDPEITAKSTASNTNIVPNVAPELVDDPQEVAGSSRTRQRKPQICPECGKVFSHKGNFQRHLMVHSGEKPFNCNFCDKRFRLKSHLKNHKRIHTNERPHTCDICQKKFTRSDSLGRHMRNHRNERSFICEKCGKAFGRKDSLKRHERTHK